MEPYQIRLINEWRELDDRIRRLSSYLMRRADELAAAPGEVTDRDFSDFCPRKNMSFTIGLIIPLRLPPDHS